MNYPHIAMQTVVRNLYEKTTEAVTEAIVAIFKNFLRFVFFIIFYFKIFEMEQLSK